MKGVTTKQRLMMRVDKNERIPSILVVMRIITTLPK